MGHDEEIRDEIMDDVEEREKSREKHRSRDKDSKKRRRDEREHGSKDRERSKDREGDDYQAKDLDRKDRVKERSARDKVREKDYDRDKYRGDKERDVERGKDRGSGDKERDVERGKDRGSGRDRDREYERVKEREKGYDNSRGRDKDRERDRDRACERDYDRDMEKERGKDKDHERGRERDRERSKERDREKEKVKDRERDKNEREPDHDKSRGRDRERERKGKEGEKEKGVKIDVGESGDVAKKGMGDHDEGVVSFSLEDHNEKSVSTQTTSLLGDRLIKVKEERLKKKSEGASEILSWVSKSRKLDGKKNAEMEKAERLSKALEEQDNILAESEDEEAPEHIAKDLAGVRILHGLDKVIEGGAVVLTLKDQNILADGDINEEADMLVNVEIGEQKQRDNAYMAAKKKPGTYDDKFNDDMSSHKTMLPQYDDPIVDEGVTLDERGRFTGEAEKKLEELRRKISGNSTGKAFEDLTSSGKTSSDYFTSDEMLQFKKPKKKKSLRKKERLDLDALEAEAVASGLGVGDLGSRNDLRRQYAKEDQERAEAEMRSNAYQTAYAKAEEASKALREEQTLTFKTVEDENIVFGEDYEDLQRSLEQARHLALKRQHEAAASGPQAVALLAAANTEKDETRSPTGEPQENKVVITEMEEFVLGLQLNEETQRPDSEDVFMDEDEVSKSFEPVIKTEVSGWIEVKEPNEHEIPVNGQKEDITPDEVIHERPVGKGLAGVYNLLRERGTLNEGIDWGGRNMDKKKSKLVGIYDNDGGINDKDIKKELHDESSRRETRKETRKEEQREIRIERTDEFGRIMTPKEAFRVISHKFHGKGPGKMKQEKRMKQYQEDLKMKQMKASDTPSQAMERMREAQARLKTPYLVLSGHVKPGQTSDPRSGFATVEKDHPGSLTPMLGDKKVEHFLGIRPGSMGPPPPKKKD